MKSYFSLITVNYNRTSLLKKYMTIDTGYTCLGL